MPNFNQSTEYRAFLIGVQYVLTILQKRYPLMAANMINILPKELFEDCEKEALCPKQE